MNTRQTQIHMRSLMLDGFSSSKSLEEVLVPKNRA